MESSQMNHEEVIQYVSQEMELFRAEKEIPGIAFGLIHEGKLVYSSGLGEKVVGGHEKPSADTVFRIASMTKSFTATAILRLRDKGLLQIEAPITTYLPWSATIGLPHASAPITVRDLLTMGAGLPTDDPWGDRQEDLPLADFDAMVKAGLTFNRNANTGFEYSNLSYALLGRIITVVTGQEYEEFMAQEILEPLGMHASTFFTDSIPNGERAVGNAKFASGLAQEPATKHGAFTPMGGLHSCVSDLAKWVATYQAGRVEEQTPYRFAQAWMAEPVDQCPERIVTSSYGYGLFIDDDAILGRSIHHSGGYPGFGSHMRWHQNSGWAIVALGNMTYAPMRVIGTRIINHLAHLHMKSSKPEHEITPATKDAIEVVNALINKWDNLLADKWFTENMDLDQPRTERIADFSKLTAGESNWKPVEGTLSAPTPSYVKWSVACQDEILEIELLMSPEKSQRIQKLTLKF
jgi:CubicO group peptidase (beta-lactamase class C family)